jgi:hypothetical protein
MRAAADPAPATESVLMPKTPAPIARKPVVPRPTIAGYPKPATDRAQYQRDYQREYQRQRRAAARAKP